MTLSRFQGPEGGINRRLEQLIKVATEAAMNANGEQEAVSKPRGVNKWQWWSVVLQAVERERKSLRDMI